MSSSEKFDWDLLKELECPICLEYMTSPIKMCENGHNICDSCGSQVLRCSLCKGGFTKARNFTLERIASVVTYPCKNRENGCKMALKMENIICHNLECVYQSRDCPFRKLSGLNCPWTGILSAIKNHVKSEHGDQTVEHSRAFQVTLQNFNKGQRFSKAIVTLDKLFYLVWQTTNDTFYFSVLSVDEKDEADRFIYDFKIGTQRDIISITGKCRSYLEDESSVLRHGECVTLHYRTVQKYLSRNAELSCEIEIRQKCIVEINVIALRKFVVTPLKRPGASENTW